jgi:hypothetical protein
MCAPACARVWRGATRGAFKPVAAAHTRASAVIRCRFAGCRDARAKTHRAQPQRCRQARAALRLAYKAAARAQRTRLLRRRRRIIQRIILRRSRAARCHRLPSCRVRLARSAERNLSPPPARAAAPRRARLPGRGREV